ncbi:MAG: hypothetical protein P4L71_15520 [Acetobacteraceae bacterium]|nr:hypothetical protein [Acetobacteraceae bacterium]
MNFAAIVLFGATLLVPLPAAADRTDPDVPGAQEYRLTKFYPQARIDRYEVKDFDAAGKTLSGIGGGKSPAGA